MAKQPMEKTPPTQGTQPQPTEYGGKYGKKNIWKWVIIYLVLAAIVYAVIYALVLKNRGSGYGQTQSQY